ncbi:MAG: 4-alpha-glucanotransferase, partial [Myxococcales bacterium]|nr:4-alpha-glucanotransferase [Myxococcales bacterium]
MEGARRPPRVPSNGAPPSRTNPEGQPWDYPVFAPRRADHTGPNGRGLFERRLDRMRRDFDGVRVDHPHGFVCPWVYRKDVPDPYAAVRAGARLFESPDLEDHPELRGFARIRADQIARTAPRFADRWVEWLSAEQVSTYAEELRKIRDAFPGPAGSRIACEVLSTCPLPLEESTRHLGLGRFRVTQKADPDNPDDVYRADRASPEDWIMVGTHDTPTIWALVDAWSSTDRSRREARALARVIDPTGELRVLDELSSDPARIGHAKFVEAFVSPASNLIVFSADWYGQRGRTNLPGVVSPENWRLRVPHESERR